MASYAIIVIDAANANALNRVLNAMNNDEGDNVGRPCSATGDIPATHYLGGWPVSAEQANTLQTLAVNLPAPAGGWPYMGVSQADAQTAVAAMYLNVNTGANVETLPAENEATVLSARTLAKI